MPTQPAVLFDMNGVVVNDEALHFSAFRLVLRRHGMRLSPASYAANFAGRTDRDGGLAFARAEAAALDIERLVADKSAVYRRLSTRGLRGYPGAAELIEALRQMRAPIGLVTGAPRKEVDAVLSALGLGGAFEVIITSDDVQSGKPSPEGYLAAAAALRIAPRHCLVIEDSPSGVQAAKSAGMACVAVCHTHAEEALMGADCVTTHIGDIGVADLMRIAAMRSSRA